MKKRANEYKRYYSNTTGLEMTGVDISLCIDYKEEQETEELCKIIFSPEQAKLTMIMLEKAIAEYEKNNRKININTANIKRTEGENKDGAKQE